VTLPVGGDQVASGPAAKDGVDLAAELQTLRRMVEELSRKTLYSASVSEGGLTIQDGGTLKVLDGDGDTTVFIGGSKSNPRPDGKPQQEVVFYDDAGQFRFAIFDPFPNENGFKQQVFMWDASGRPVFSMDNAGGLAQPWVDVSLYPKFSMAAGSTWDYMTIAPSTTERTLWEGRIPSTCWPKMAVDGVWGVASGTGTHTYRVKINGVTKSTTVYSSGLHVERLNHCDISDMLNQVYVSISITLQSSAGATGLAACQVLGCMQRDSETD
jgi:hypothetical protein